MPDHDSKPVGTEGANRSALLFLCDGNAARSQMAEGFARFLGPKHLEIFSAGTTRSRLDPNAVRAMKEVRIDISGYRAKSLDDIPKERIFTVINLGAEDDHPAFPFPVHHLHWPLPDPTALGGNADAVFAEFRRVRDQIRELVSRLF